MLLLLFLSGCFALSKKDYHIDGDRDFPIKARPYLMFLSGVPGPIKSDKLRFHALQLGGYDGDIEVFNWTGRNTSFDALHNVDDNRRAARRAAERITEIRRAGPDRPIHIYAVSGGPIIAAWLLEDLPPDVQVDRVVMTSPGMSPDFDLSRALSHVKDRCFVFSSKYDFIVSSILSHIWGTMDRKYVDTAGRWGFTCPPQGDPMQYRKLVDIKYEWAFLIYGNSGTHMGASENPFIEHYIAKLLILP